MSNFKIENKLLLDSIYNHYKNLADLLFKTKMRIVVDLTEQCLESHHWNGIFLFDEVDLKNIGNHY